MAKVFVYWLKEKMWSIVSEQAVRGGDFLPGDYVQTKFQGKLYPSIVIASKWIRIRIVGMVGACAEELVFFHRCL